jgi:PPK2 family polyphosphate:nucleotide phosphotransferase
MISPVKPGSKVDLNGIDADQADLLPDGKDAAARKLEKLQARIAELQERFFIDHSHKMLVVFQGMDTAGKSGTIKSVFSATHPQGISVASFKRPTAIELAHDYLWRVHARVPALGEIVLFDRSHYEDITAVRVLELVPRKQWERRFEHIRAFERMLVDEGTIILKFFLHISLDEQKERLSTRLSERTKQWKFEPADLETRKRWADYMRAHSDAIAETAAKHAPWFIVPSNRRWVRNLVVASVVADALEKLKLRYPKPDFDPASIHIV